MGVAGWTVDPHVHTRCHGGVRREAGPGHLPLCRRSLGRLCRGLTYPWHPSQCWPAPSPRDAKHAKGRASRPSKHQDARSANLWTAKHAKSISSRGPIPARSSKFSASSFARNSKCEDAKHRPGCHSESYNECSDRHSFNSWRGDEDCICQPVAEDRCLASLENPLIGRC